MTDIIFVGNPGTGKSTLLSCISGQRFESGVSFGAGLTSELRFQPKLPAEVRYGDTPGLADISLKKAAADAITKALKDSQSKRRKSVICFVTTTESGRVRPADLHTIRSVMGSVTVNGKKAGKNDYCVIVNKFAKKTYHDKDKMKLAQPQVEKQFRTPADGTDICTDIILFIPKDENLEDEDNASKMENGMNQILNDFLLGPKSPAISIQQVAELELLDREAFEKKIQALEEQMKRNERKPLPRNPLASFLDLGAKVLTGAMTGGPMGALAGAAQGLSELNDR